MGKVAYTGRGSEAQWDGSGDGVPRTVSPEKLLGASDACRATCCVLVSVVFPGTAGDRERESLSCDAPPAYTHLRRAYPGYSGQRQQVRGKRVMAEKPVHHIHNMAPFNSTKPPQINCPM